MEITSFPAVMFAIILSGDATEVERREHMNDKPHTFTQPQRDREKHTAHLDSKMPLMEKLLSQVLQRAFV